MKEHTPPHQLLAQVRAHLQGHPVIHENPLLLHQRGALLGRIRASRAYRAEGYPDFRAFCAALYGSGATSGHTSAVAAIKIYKGYSEAELLGSRASSGLLTRLLAFPRPRRAALLAQTEGLRRGAIRALLDQAAQEQAARAPAPPPPPAPAPAPTPVEEDPNPLDQLVIGYLAEHDEFMRQAEEIQQRWEAQQPMHQDLLVLLKHAAIERRTLHGMLVDALHKDVARLASAEAQP